jgi:nitronate monooxygenase
VNSFEDLGLTLPIVQAPMAGVQDHRLAAATCEVGALGSLPGAMFSPESLRAELTQLTRRTSRPFNVNFFCHATPTPDAEKESRWREALAPYYRELGIDPSTIPSGGGRRGFDHETADVVEEFRPAVISFHFGLPTQPLLERVKSWGSLVLASATTVDEGRWLEARGADVIIAQGIEAGGHRGHFLSDDLSRQPSTFDLVSGLVAAVSVPVIAAGGITDAAAVRRALSHGAVAAQVGTSYLLCPEATTSAVHRRAIASSDARTTALTNLFSGRPARGIVNRLMRDLGPMSTLPPAFPLAAAAITPLRAAAERNGSGDFSPLWAGTNVSGAQAIPAGELTLRLRPAAEPEGESSERPAPAAP